jgi:hypothetical protein
MSCLGELERVERAIFADTGWEPKAVYEHLDWLAEFSAAHGIPVDRISCGRNIKADEVSATVRGIKANGQRFASLPYFTKTGSGSFGMIRRQCTREYKIDPIKRHLRKLVSPPRRTPDLALPIVEQWYGISIDEAQRMRLADTWWIINHYPLVEIGMTRDGCLQWLDKNGFKRPVRSACIGCPFKHDNEWRWLRDNSPGEWQEAIAFDEVVRKNGGEQGDLFIHASREPLKDVDLSTPEDHGQLNLWNAECAGVCGV